MKNLEANGSMLQTRDYKIFKFLKENRKLNQLHVNSLIDSLKSFNDLHLNPIKVDKDLNVIDGQHRLEAAKTLGLKVYYLIDENYDPSKLALFNTTQRRWTPEDYMNFWIQQGREDYKKFSEFKDEIQFSLPTLLSWLHSHGRYIDFRLGTFKFEMTELLLKSMLNTKVIIEKLKQLNYKPVKMFNHASFHQALKKFLLSGIVDIERFITKIESTPYRIKYSDTWRSYFEQFVEIYNYDCRRNRLNIIQDGKKIEISL